MTRNETETAFCDNACHNPSSELARKGLEAAGDEPRGLPHSVESVPKQGPWFIVNMRRFWEPGSHFYRSNRPFMVHGTLAVAFAEANRLATKNPKGHYAVFECIGFLKAKQP